MYAAFCLLFSLNFLNQPITIDKSVESTLVGASNKELAYLHEFGQPLLPFERIRRENYKYQEQSPSDHIDNLHRAVTYPKGLISQSIPHPPP